MREVASLRPTAIDRPHVRWARVEISHCKTQQLRLGNATKCLSSDSLSNVLTDLAKRMNKAPSDCARRAAKIRNRSRPVPGMVIGCWQMGYQKAGS